MRTWFSTSLLLLGAASSLLGQAQRKVADTPASRKLIEIKVSGTERYSQAEVLAASGLAVGDSAGDEDFKKAAERLGETGVFADVAYAFSYSPSGTKLELQLRDNDKFVPVRFENFVWFTDAELDSELRIRAPLFKGAVPVAGGLLEQLNDALQALLLERKLPGRVDYLRGASLDSGVIDAIRFSVTDVQVTIQKVSFSGASAAEEPELQAASKKLIGTEYTRDAVSTYGKFEWLPVYLRRGNLKAAFSDAQPRVLRQEGTATEVELVVAVEPGIVYKVDGVSWDGNQVVSAEKLGTMVHLKGGEPADAVRLQEALKTIQKSYGSKGYMACAVSPVATFDDAQGTVSYRFEIKEGDQYKMGELDLTGLDTNTTSRVRGAWSLREGEPYDSSYAARFLDEAVKVLPKDQTWTMDVRESVNASDKTVDVNLKFATK